MLKGLRARASDEAAAMRASYERANTLNARSMMVVGAIRVTLAS